MQSKEIYDMWTKFTSSNEYSQYFLSNEQIWLSKFQELKNYLDINQQRPSKYSKNAIIKQLSNWLATQLATHKKRTQIMKTEEIYNIWSDFIKNPTYSHYFISKIDIWVSKFQELKNYLDTNQQKPSDRSKDPNTKQLARWLNKQLINRKNRMQIMKTEKIYNMWRSFITSNEYSKYFLTNSEIWVAKFIKVKRYINKNCRRPSSESKLQTISQLGRWLQTQITRYKSRDRIMKDPKIYNTFKNFITSNEYSSYFPNMVDSDDSEDDRTTSDAEDQDD